MTRALILFLVLVAVGFGVSWLRRDAAPVEPPSGGPDPVVTQGSDPVAGPLEVPNAAPELTCIGRVVDATGAGVAGVSLGASSSIRGFGGPFEDTGRYVARTETDAEGRFVLALPRVGPFWIGPLLEQGKQFPLGQPAPFECSGAVGDPPLLFTLEAPHEIEGHVRLEDLPGVDLTKVRVLALGERTGQSALASIDAEGRFTLSSLCDEPFVLTAMGVTFVANAVHGVAVGTQDVELTFGAIGALSVEVEGGSPPGVRVECARLGGHPLDVARGLYSGRSPSYLLPGAYAVAVYTQTDYGRVMAESIGTSERPERVPVVLTPAGSLDVANVRPGPIVVIVEEAGEIARAQTFPIGAQMVLVVPPGNLVVRVHSFDGALLETRPVQVAAGARVPVRIGAH